MASVCLYFQVHQPFRLRRYSVFDTDAFYFDDARNAEICRRVADRCYLPANRLLREAIRRFDGDFRVAFSITGVALEQFDRYAPLVSDSFSELVQTGSVELLAETYHHSLASLFSPAEFRDQVEMHRAEIERRFGRRPTVFRNTELIHSDAIAAQARAMDFAGCLIEGVAGPGGTSREGGLASIYRAPGEPGFRLLPRNYRLSDDMTFRFGDRTWDQWPLTADRFAAWVQSAAAIQNSDGVNLFVDYEAFGEHQEADTGILAFLEHLPVHFLSNDRHRFVTPGQRIEESNGNLETLSIDEATSWADSERDVSAWLGNAMQENAARELYKLEPAVRAAGDDALLRDWRLLQSSDHFYYMSTKYFADGAVHKYFSPYESPYDSYINFMNVLDNIKSRAGG